ncbi:MAG: triple tyrosine motif-containing protein [Saprospiraceae bacterium]
MFWNLTAQVPISLPVTLISRSDGLTETDNRFIYKDSEGFVWISSIQGLNRYDGKHVKTYLPDSRDSTSLKGLMVNGYFFEDVEKNIWFTTYDAVNCYIRKKDIFQSYTNPDNTEGGYFSGGLDSLGQLWLLYDTLLVTFDIHTHQFASKARVRSGVSRLQITLNPKGEISRAYTFNTERSLPGFDIIDFEGHDSIRSRSYFTRVDAYPFVVRNIYTESNSSLWIASHTGLIHMNPETKDTTVYSPFPEKEFVYFNHVKRLNDSLLIIASYGKGVFTFHIRKKIFINHYQFNFNDVPVRDPLQVIYMDNEGGVWVSVLGKGVAYFHAETLFFRYYKHTISTSLLTSGIYLNSLIEIGDGTVWGSSFRHGAVRMKDASQIIENYNRDITKEWIADNTKKSYLDCKGRIWTLTASGPCIRYPDNSVKRLVSDSIFSVADLCETNIGEILLAPDQGGLYRCIEHDLRQFILKRIESVDLSLHYTLLYQHSDQMIFGTANMTTLDIYDPEKDFALIQSIPLSVNALCMTSLQSGKEIWIGTNDGIYSYSTASESMMKPEWLDFLHSIIVYGIVPVDDRYVWLSTNHGIYNLDLKKLTYEWYDLNNGAGPMAFNPNSFLRRTNGEIWFGSLDGIIVFDPSKESHTSPISNLYISKILINDSETRLLTCAQTGATNVAELKYIKLPFSNRTLSFEFTAFDYEGPDHATYEYRMKGIDVDWIVSDHGGFARYANLRPGDYRFEARSGNGSPDSYSPIRSLDIRIIAPFYQQWWFISIALVLAGLLFFLIVRFFEKRKQELQRLAYENQLAIESERLRIANDMHDDLGSGLSALSLRAKIISSQLKEPGLQSQMEELVGNTNRLTRQIRETIWTINSKNDTIDNLVTRLHQYSLEYMENSGITCNIELMEEQIHTPIPGAHRRAIYLTYKEALHNIVKHAQATKVLIHMNVDSSRHLIIDILDDGKGFNPEQLSSGLGMASMKKRMEEIGGIFSLSSSDQGTHVVFSYPV